MQYPPPIPHPTKMAISGLSISKCCFKHAWMLFRGTLPGIARITSAWGPLPPGHAKGGTHCSSPTNVRYGAASVSRPSGPLSKKICLALLSHRAGAWSIIKCPWADPPFVPPFLAASPLPWEAEALTPATARARFCSAGHKGGGGACLYLVGNAVRNTLGCRAHQ